MIELTFHGLVLGAAIGVGYAVVTLLHTELYAWLSYRRTESRIVKLQARLDAHNQRSMQLAMAASADTKTPH